MNKKRGNVREQIRGGLPTGSIATDSEKEQVLLERVQSWIENGVTTSYLAATDLHHLLEVTEAVEIKAWCFLKLGQIAEMRGQYDAAIDFYTRGLTFRTQDKAVKYLLHNNTGYCLNVQGMHKEAETYCRLAIEIDSSKANALKNLGISLAGQNELIGAAWAWFEAIRADATDPRASQLLQILLEDHPEVVAQFYGVLTQLEDCKKAGLQ